MASPTSAKAQSLQTACLFFILRPLARKRNSVSLSLSVRWNPMTDPHIVMSAGPSGCLTKASSSRLRGNRWSFWVADVHRILHGSILCMESFEGVLAEDQLLCLKHCWLM